MTRLPTYMTGPYAKIRGVKPCRKCGETKPLEDFVKDKRCKDGRTARCKACSNADQRRRHVENGHIVSKRAWREANRKRVRERGRERMAKWRRANPEKARAAAIRDRIRLLEANPNYFREWYATNIETQRQQGLERAHRRRALAGSTPRDLADYMAELRKQNCAYCGSDENVTVDHVIPLARGGRHERHNLVPACMKCNCSKGTKTLEEWLPSRAA